MPQSVIWPPLRDALEPALEPSFVALDTASNGAVPSETLARVATISQAISLKRIADALELLAYGDNDHAGLLAPR